MGTKKQVVVYAFMYGGTYGWIVTQLKLN